MGAEPQEREIDGVRFSVRPLLLTRSLKLLTRLTKVLGPSVAMLAARESRGDAIAEAIRLLGDKLSPEEFETLWKEALQGASYAMPDGSCGVLLDRMDIVLQGRPETFLKALAFALEVNYGGFFPGLKGLAERAAAKGLSFNSPSTSPKLG